MTECEEEETDAGGGEVESRGWNVNALKAKIVLQRDVMVNL